MDGLHLNSWTLGICGGQMFVTGESWLFEGETESPERPPVSFPALGDASKSRRGAPACSPVSSGSGQVEKFRGSQPHFAGCCTIIMPIYKRVIVLVRVLYSATPRRGELGQRVLCTTFAAIECTDSRYAVHVPRGLRTLRYVQY
jgi:hypothetical protein